METNEEKAREIAGVFVEYHTALFAARRMAQWKDVSHQQALIDLNCKLEEQQACYEELKKRYDEAVERERIATKIINDMRKEKDELKALVDTLQEESDRSFKQRMELYKK